MSELKAEVEDDSLAAPFVSIPENPVPEGGVFRWLERPDGMRLRYAVWKPRAGGERSVRGTFYVVPGRTEYIEKYFEVVRELLDRGYGVVVADPRGQGLSTRELPERWKGHVLDFEKYVADLDAVVRVTGPDLPQPVFLLGHSMGGNIALRFLEDHAERIARVVLTAPMIDIGIRGLTGFLVRVIAYYSGLAGASERYVLGTRNPDPHAERFEDNPVTSHRQRYEWTQSLWQAEPNLALGPPTFGWLAAAFRSIAKVRSSAFARSVQTPILMFSAGLEKLVDNTAQRRLVMALPRAELVEIAESMHEILMETDEIRQKFWVAVDAFLQAETTDEA